MSFESPFKVLYNNAGAEVAVVSGSAMDAARPGVGMLAKNSVDGGAEWLKVNASGQLMVEAAVDVALTASNDSVQVYGSQDVALQQDAENRLIVSDLAVSGAVVAMESVLNGQLSTLNAVDFAKDATLQAATSSLAAIQAIDFAKDPTLQAATSSLAVIQAVDFAKDATLQAATSSLAVIQAVDFAKDATLQAATSSLAVIQAVDFAKDATLQAATSSLAVIQAVDFAKDATVQAATSSLAVIQAIDFAKDATLQAATSSLAVIQAVDFAKDATVQAATSSLAVIQAIDFAKDATLQAATSSLAQFQFDGDALIVTGNLDVNVGLTASGSAAAGYGAYDTVNIFGDEGVPFAQISGSGEMITVPLGSEGNSLLQAASGSTHSDVNGNGALLVGLLGSNSNSVLLSSTDNVLYVSAALNDATLSSNLSTLAAVDFAKDATLQAATSSLAVVQAIDFAKDATLQAATSSLGVIQAIDFAKDATLQAATSSLAVIQAVDFAKDATMQAATSSLAVIQAIDFAKDATLQAATSSLAVIQAIDFAKDATLQAATSSLAALEGALNVAGNAVMVGQSGSWVVDRLAGTTAAISEEADPNGKVLDIATDGAFGASFYWSSPAGGICYIALGGAASSTNFTVKLVNGGYYEMPAMFKGDVYASGSGAGNLYVTAINA